VLDYVNRDDRAIGIIDYSAISDSDEPYTKRVLAEATLLGISRPADSTQFGFVRPYQYNLQDRKYPFTRDLYVISKSGKTDVGIGFASFIAGEIGQKIILKAGLLPRYQSERVLEIGPVEDIKVVK
jgi:phosphate transport system substrate-binding protein